MLPQFYKGRDGKPPFAVDSFYDVLSGKIPAAKYADKIVLIGATAAGVGMQFPAPGYAGRHAGGDDRAHHLQHPGRALHRAAGLGRAGRRWACSCWWPPT